MRAILVKMALKTCLVLLACAVSQAAAAADRWAFRNADGEIKFGYLESEFATPAIRSQRAQRLALTERADLVNAGSSDGK